MSFDLFVCPLPGATWGDTERKLAIDVLHRDADTTDKSWRVRYVDGGAREISGLDDWDDDTDRTRGLCFRHFGGQTFKDRLFELADRLEAMVFWPGIPPMVAVTRQDLLARLPVELRPSDSVAVCDAEDLMAQICK